MDQKTTSTQNYKSSWTKTEINNLATALAFCYKTQTTYQEPLDIKDRIQGWRFVLEDDYSMDDILKAIKVFMKKKNIMPTPSDIVSIISPEKPKITQAQYIQACKERDRDIQNGTIEFMCPNKQIIDEYDKQEYGCDELIPLQLKSGDATALPDKRLIRSPQEGNKTPENVLNRQIENIDDKRKWIDLDEDEKKDLKQQLKDTIEPVRNALIRVFEIPEDEFNNQETIM